MTLVNGSIVAFFLFVVMNTICQILNSPVKSNFSQVSSGGATCPTFHPRMSRCHHPSGKSTCLFPAYILLPHSMQHSPIPLFLILTLLCLTPRIHQPACVKRVEPLKNQPQVTVTPPTCSGRQNSKSNSNMVPRCRCSPWNSG